MAEYYSPIQNKIQGPRRVVGSALNRRTSEDAEIVRQRYAQQQTPVQDSPEEPVQRTVREEDGSIGSVDVEKLTQHKTLLQAVKDVIKIKQGGNKDIRQAKDYWRTVARDTTPFGGARDEALKKPGFIDDERLRQLSPAQQASVRSARYGAAQSHLQGLSEEERFRETRMSDTIKAVADMLAEKDKLAKTEQDNISKLLTDMKKKEDLGIPLTDEDYKRVGTISTDGRTGGTVSWRHNNPLNIKSGSFAEGYGATKGQGATDGGAFAIFPTLEAGIQAAKDLLVGRNYRDLPLNRAMKRWSGGINKDGSINPNKGYDTANLFEQIQQTPSWAGKSTGEMNNEELNQLMGLMKTQEDWGVGTMIGTEEEETLGLSEAEKVNFMQRHSLTNAEVKDLTDDDWILMQQVVKSKSIEKATIEAQKMVKEATIPNAIKIKDKISSDYPDLSTADVETILNNIGFERKAGVLQSTYTPIGVFK